MTKKELEELVKEQSKQISDLISLVQNQKKETVIITEPENKLHYPYPTSPWPINPYVTWCGTRISNNSSGSSIPNERWDKEPEMIQNWDKLGLVAREQKEGMV